MNKAEKDSLEITIGTLREDRKQAILLHQYTKAKELEDKINSLTIKKRTSDKIAKKTSCENNLEKEKQKLRSNAMKLQSKYIQQIYLVRSIFQQRYIALLNKQEEEVRKLANDFARNVEYAATRRVPQSVELMRISQLKAGISQYEVANQLSKEASYVQTTTLQQRQDEVHFQFQQQQDHLLRQQQAETDGHLKKLQNEIDLIHVDYKKEIGKLKQALITHGITFKVEVSSEEADDFFSIYTINDDEEGSVPDRLPMSPRSSQIPKKTQFSLDNGTPKKSPKSMNTSGTVLKSPTHSPVYSKSPVFK